MLRKVVRAQNTVLPLRTRRVRTWAVICLGLLMVSPAELILTRVHASDRLRQPDASEPTGATCPVRATTIQVVGCGGGHPGDKCACRVYHFVNGDLTTIWCRKWGRGTVGTPSAVDSEVKLSNDGGLARNSLIADVSLYGRPVQGINHWKAGLFAYLPPTVQAAPPYLPAGSNACFEGSAKAAIALVLLDARRHRPIHFSERLR